MRNLIHGLFQIDKIFYSGVTIPIIRSYRVWIATWWTKALLSISNSADPVFEAMHLTQSSSWSYQHSTLWKIEEWRDPHLIGVNDRVQRRSSAKLNGDVPCQEVAIDDSIICNCYIVVKVWAMFVIEGPAPWANWRPSPILMDERLGLVRTPGPVTKMLQVAYKVLPDKCGYKFPAFVGIENTWVCRLLFSSTHKDNLSVTIDAC